MIISEILMLLYVKIHSCVQCVFAKYPLHNDGEGRREK